MLENLLFCAVCCCFATAVQTISGFGFGILVMATLPHLIPSTLTCTAMIGLTSVVNSCAIAWKYRKKLNWKAIVFPLLAYFPMSFLAISFAGQAGEGILRKILGVCLILLGLYFLFAQNRLKVKGNAVNGLIAGGTAGILSGLFNTGGPPMVVYLKGVSEDNEEYIGTIQIFFVMSNFYNSVVRAAKGLITKEVLMLTAVAIAASLGGVLIGRRLLGKIGENQQNLVIYLLMIFSGVMLLF